MTVRLRHLSSRTDPSAVKRRSSQIVRNRGAETPNLLEVEPRTELDLQRTHTWDLPVAAVVFAGLVRETHE